MTSRPGSGQWADEQSKMDLMKNYELKHHEEI